MPGSQEGASLPGASNAYQDDTNYDSQAENLGQKLADYLSQLQEEDDSKDGKGETSEFDKSASSPKASSPHQEEGGDDDMEYSMQDLNKIIEESAGLAAQESKSNDDDKPEDAKDDKDDKDDNDDNDFANLNESLAELVRMHAEKESDKEEEKNQEDNEADEDDIAKMLGEALAQANSESKSHSDEEQDAKAKQAETDELLSTLASHANSPSRHASENAVDEIDTDALVQALGGDDSKKQDGEFDENEFARAIQDVVSLPAPERAQEEEERQGEEESKDEKDISNMFLSALEMALGGSSNDQDEEKESEETTEKAKDTTDQDHDVEMTNASFESEKEPETEFDLGLLQELLMSADKKSEPKEVAAAPAESQQDQAAPEEDGEDHQEILAQLSSLLHPDDVEEPATQETQAPSEGQEQANQLDFSMVVSALQSALEEAASSEQAQDSTEDNAEEDRSTFSKLEIQDALKSLTDSDGSILLDLSSKQLNQSKEDGSSVAPADDDEEETRRSTANLVEVLLQSGLLGTDSLDQSSEKRGSQLANRAKKAGRASQPSKTATPSRYTSSMSIAETLAYSRAQMLQRPSDGKIDPMVARRDINKAIKKTPTYYTPSASSSSVDSSYRMYTPAQKKSSTGPSQMFREAKAQGKRSTGSASGQKTKFYYYTPPTAAFKQADLAKDRPQSQSKPADGDSSAADKDNNLIATLLGKRGSNDDKQTEVNDLGTIKALQAALEAVTSQSPQQPASSSSASTAQSTPTRTSFSTRRRHNPLVDDRERIRMENRERKKRWRGANMDRNKDTDLRGRVVKKAKELYGLQDTPAKLEWIEKEFEARKMKRLERGVGFESFSLYGANKPKRKSSVPVENPVQSVMPEGTQQRFGSTETNDNADKSEDRENWMSGKDSSSGEDESRPLSRQSSPVVRGTPSASNNSTPSVSNSKTGLSASGAPTPAFFASRGAKAPTSLPLGGGIVTSFKVNTAGSKVTKSKSHLFTSSSTPAGTSSGSSAYPQPPSFASPASSSASAAVAALKRKRSVDPEVMSSTKSPSVGIYSSLVPAHLLPKDTPSVPIPRPLPFEGPSSRASTPSTGGPNAGASGASSSSSTPGTPSNGASSAASASAAAGTTTKTGQEKRIRAMGFPPVLSGLSMSHR